MKPENFLGLLLLTIIIGLWAMITFTALLFIKFW